MNSIVYVGMDVHKDSFTLTYFDKVKNETKKSVTFPSDVKNVVKYVENIKVIKYRIRNIRYGESEKTFSPLYSPFYFEV